MKRALLFACFACVAGPAFAADVPLHAECQDMGSVKELHKEMGKDKGTWTSMSHDQWEFLRGIYALNPQTSAGLPPGDRAELIVLPNGHGFVLFEEGSKGCDIMMAPKPLQAFIEAVGRKGEPM